MLQEQLRGFELRILSQQSQAFSSTAKDHGLNVLPFRYTRLKNCIIKLDRIEIEKAEFAECENGKS